MGKGGFEGCPFPYQGHFSPPLAKVCGPLQLSEGALTSAVMQQRC